MKIKLSKQQWKNIGEKNGWNKKAQFDRSTEMELYNKLLNTAAEFFYGECSIVECKKRLQEVFDVEIDDLATRMVESAKNWPPSM